MDFSTLAGLSKELRRFQQFLDQHVAPHFQAWNQDRALPRDLFRALGKGGWFGFRFKEGGLVKGPSVRAAMVMEQFAKVCPGAAVAALAHADLGIMALWLFGSSLLQHGYGRSAVRGETLLCLGNTESGAGSDVANVKTKARETDGGWVLNGAKVYVTNGTIGHRMVVTAVSEPKARRNNRLSMFLVDLQADGVHRTKLSK